MTNGYLAEPLLLELKLLIIECNLPNLAAPVEYNFVYFKNSAELKQFAFE